MPSPAQLKQSREVALKDFVPQLRHLTPYIVKTKTDEYQALFKVDGISFETIDEEIKDSYHLREASWLKNICDGQFAVSMYRINHKVPTKLDYVYHNDFAHDFAEKYLSRFKSKDSLQLDIFIVLHFRPLASKFERDVFKSMSTEALKIAEAEYLDALEDKCLNTMTTLKKFGIERMGMYDKEVQHEGGPSRIVTYSNFYSFIGFLVNGVWAETPVAKKDVNEYIVYSNNNFKQDIRKITNPLGEKFASYLEITDYPEEYQTGALNKVLSLQCEFVECITFLPFDKVSAREQLDTLEGFVLSSGDMTDYEEKSFLQAKEALKSGHVVFGECSYSIGLFSEKLEDLKKFKSDFFAVMADSNGFQSSALNLLSMDGFFSQIAGNWDYRTRIAFISDLAFTGICSLHNHASGKRAGNPWGDCVTIFETDSGKPFFFNFHATPEDQDNEFDKAPANTIIIGMTGSGKTVVESALLTQITKVPKLRFTAYDKDCGLKPLILRLGGIYFEILVGTSTGWNPFQSLTNTEKNRNHLNDLVHQCALLNDPAPLDISDKLKIEHAVNAVFNLPIEKRSFTTLLQNITDTERNSLKEKLRSWCRGDDGRPHGKDAWIFDNPRDLLNYKQASYFGFDMTDILDLPINKVIMFHLLHRQNELINGDPFIYIMAEAWKALDNPFLEDFIRNKQKTIRKQNGFGVFDTQEIGDIANTLYGESIIQQTATFIALANGSAVWKDFQKANFSVKEFDIIRNKLVSGDRRFLVKQGMQSNVCRLDLNGFDRELLILSGDLDTGRILDGVIQANGLEHFAWVEPFYKEVDRIRARATFVDHSFDADIDLEVLPPYLPAGNPVFQVS
jgi:type IV secretion system protein VirB4